MLTECYATLVESSPAGVDAWSVINAVETSGIGTFELDLVRKVSRRSHRHDQLFGYTGLQPNWSRDVAERNVLSADTLKLRNAFEKAAAGQDIFIAIRVRWPDDTVHTIQIRGRAELDVDRKPLRVSGIASDVTGGLIEFEAGHNLSTRVEWFTAAVQSSEDAILTVDQQSRITSWNPAAERLFGYTAAEAIGMSTMRLSPPEMQEAALTLANSVMNGEGAKRFQTTRISKQGRRFDASITWSPIYSQGGQIIGRAVIVRDVTEQLQAQLELRQAQKMEAMGQLTGGVAHDFNNILTVITGALDLLEDSGSRKPEIAKLVALTDEAAQRGAELTHHLLAFARKQPLRPRSTDVYTTVADTVRLLRPALGEKVQIALASAPSSWRAMIDPSQLSNAIVNLTLNARDAMPEGGVVTIECSNMTVSNEGAADVAPGDYVVITIRDTGHGVADEHLSRVFEPFFTTKPAGEGTGLGLSMVYGFIKQSDGHIQFSSRVGEGTAVKLYLPRAWQPNWEENVNVSGKQRMPTGHETILVVEDDQLVRALAVSQLISLGYRILQAADGAEALEVLASHPEIDLLFTDVILAGKINGPALAAEARSRAPTLKVLFTSGYTDNAINQNSGLDPGALLLPKPYRRGDLSDMLRRALRS